MATNEELVRYLSSAATYNSEGTEFYLHTSGGSLTEKTYDGAEWSLPTQVGKTKANGPAAYVIGSTTRVAFALTENGTLQNYVYNEDEDSWEEGKLATANVTPHPNSNITVTIENDKPHVYFQCSHGKLEVYCSDDAVNWVSGGHLAAEAKPAPGTALASIVGGEDQVYIIYQHEDGSLHYQVKDNKAGSWTDKKLDNGEVGSPVTKIIGAGPNDNGEFDVYYLTQEGNITHVSPEGKTEIGTLDAEGNFKAATSAECYFVRRGCWPPCPPRCRPRCGW